MSTESFGKTKFNSLVRAIVMNNDDPEKLGRVQVRIYSRVSSVDYGNIKDEDLPWATPCAFSASCNSGTFILPEVGNIVYILFENGDSFRPVYLGGVYGQGTETPTTIGNTVSRKRLIKAMTNELPVEAKNADIKVVYKSPKGTKILIDDSDGKEAISIVDSCGQIIGLTSPMAESFSLNNQHLTNSNVANQSFSRFDGIKSSARILLKSLSESFLQITSKIGSSLVTLKAAGSAHSFFEMTGGASSNIKIHNNGKKISDITQDDNGITLHCGQSLINVNSDKITLQVGVNSIVMTTTDITYKTAASKIHQAVVGTTIEDIVSIDVKSGVALNLGADTVMTQNSKAINLTSDSYLNISGSIANVPGCPSATPVVVTPAPSSINPPPLDADVTDNAKGLF